VTRHKAEISAGKFGRGRIVAWPNAGARRTNNGDWNRPEAMHLNIELSDKLKDIAWATRRCRRISEYF
jgi:hypothetical protein